MKWLGRMKTIGDLFRHFASRERALLLPLLAILLLAGVLLVLTTGLAKIAPFVYTLF